MTKRGGGSMARLASPPLLIILCAQSAHAQATLDATKVTCDQFLGSRHLFSFAYWLSGYYHGQCNDPVIDTELSKANVRKLRAACSLTKTREGACDAVIEAAKSQ